MVTIKASKDLRPVTDLKSAGAAIVRQVNDTQRPIILTKHGRGVAVMLSLGEYEQLTERLDDLELQLAVAEAERDFDEGRTVPHAHMVSKIRRWADGQED